MNKKKRIITLMALSLLLFGCNKEKEQEQGPVVNPNMGNVNTNTEVDPGGVQDVEPADLQFKELKEGETPPDPNENANLTPTIKHGKIGKKTEPISKEEEKERQKILEEFGEVPPLEEHEYYEDIKVNDKTFKDIYLDEEDGKFHSELESDKPFNELQIVVRYYDEDGNQLDYKIMFLDYTDSITEDPNFSFGLDGVDPDKVASITIEPFTGAGSKNR